MPRADATPETLRDPAEVEAFVQTILPGLSLDFEGVSHVAAGVVRGGAYSIFRVAHPRAPRSRWDRFLLDVSRLRADAIVISGAILRDEPRLVYRTEPGWAEAFSRMRKAMGRRERPLLFVLTRRGVDETHPVFDAHVEGVIVRDASGLDEVIERARARGARSISIESGPALASTLYTEGSPLDELLFHRFDVALPEDALVGRFADEASVRALLGAPRSSVLVDDGGVRSVVERYAR